MEPRPADLPGSICAVAGSLHLAEHTGALTLDLPPVAGQPAVSRVLEVALCAEHAHDLRGGADLHSIDLKLGRALPVAELGPG